MNTKLTCTKTVAATEFIDILSFLLYLKLSNHSKFVSQFIMLQVKWYAAGQMSRAASRLYPWFIVYL